MLTEKINVHNPKHPIILCIIKIRKIEWHSKSQENKSKWGKIILKRI